MAEGPHKLPTGWKWVRLGEVCQINPRRPRLVRNDDAPTSFVPMNAVDENTGTIIEIQVRPFAEVKSGYRYFQEGDVLFAKITPCMENGKAAIARGLIDGIGFGSTEFHVLRPKQEVMAEWIWLFVRQERFREDAKANFRGGVGQQRVPQEFLVRYPVPLPPLKEQRRIVARIEELMERVREAKRLREEAKKNADRLMQAALAEVFPRPGAPLPSGWRWVKLGEVAEVFSGVWGEDPQQSQGKGEVVRVIRVSDIKEDLNLAYQEAPKRIVKPNQARRYALKQGDIVVVKSSGSQAKVISGRAALFLEQPEVFIPSNFTFGVRCREKLVNAKFIWYWLNSDGTKAQIKQLVSTFTYPNLKKKDYVTILIPLPPLEEQRRIVAYLEAVQEKIRALKAAQEETDKELKRLEQAILDKAFRGEL